MMQAGPSIGSGWVSGRPSAEVCHAVLCCVVWCAVSRKRVCCVTGCGVMWHMHNIRALQLLQQGGQDQGYPSIKSATLTAPRDIGITSPFNTYDT